MIVCANNTSMAEFLGAASAPDAAQQKEDMRGPPTRLFLSKDNLPAMLFRIYNGIQVRMHRASPEGHSEGEPAFVESKQDRRNGSITFFNEIDTNPRLKFGQRVQLSYGNEPIRVRSDSAFAEGLVIIQEYAKGQGQGERELANLAWFWEFLICGMTEKGSVGFSTGEHIELALAWSTVVLGLAGLLGGATAAIVFGGAAGVKAVILLVIPASAGLLAVLSPWEYAGFFKTCRAYLKRKYLATLKIVASPPDQVGDDSNVWQIMPVPGSRNNVDDDILWGTSFVLKNVSHLMSRKAGDIYLGVDGNGKMVFSPVPFVLAFVTTKGTNPVVDGLECTFAHVQEALAELGVDLHTPCALKAVRDSQLICPTGFAPTLDMRDYVMVCVEKQWDTYMHEVQSKVGMDAYVSFQSLIEEYSEYVRVLEGVGDVKDVRPLTHFQEMFIAELYKRTSATTTEISSDIYRNVLVFVTDILKSNLRALVRRMEVALELQQAPTRTSAAVSNQSHVAQQNTTTHTQTKSLLDDPKQMAVAAIALGIAAAVVFA